ncbi:hypothetical protein PR202_ga16668 [Eleusine coracana subsp. coracana]|uniref:RNase H type-1 domain-containing protein n=1 Tax=Eleusine coracana subsp. coracana TaxID=191504 RepID=A0AAV5CMH0_ELECO|nr:hypothetical protein PR202_ga16668 [Eleusine coracana subsp. coracana]
MHKLNVDAAMSKNRGIVTAAVVARDVQGRFVGMSVLVMQGAMDPEVVEALACPEGMCLAADLILRDFRLACDNTGVVRSLKEGSLGAYGHVIQEIKVRAANFGRLSSNGSGSSNDISPVYSLWATFIGLYIANYVVERSTGWALTHPLTISEYEKLKKQLKPDFEDMVPWYSGTSADLFKTVFDLMISVTLFVGRFDMRMMQVYQLLVYTGDGGNSTYAVARLLAQPSYPNPSSFSYERRFFCPFEYALQPPAWYKAEHIALEKPELPLGVSELRQYRGPECFMIPGNHGNY